MTAKKSAQPLSSSAAEGDEAGGPHIAYGGDAVALDKQAALKIAHNWVDRRLERPGQEFIWSETRSALLQLVECCVAENSRLDENQEALETRLQGACEIVFDLHYALSEHLPPVIGRELTLEEQRSREAKRHTLWRRKNPMRAFEEGLASPHFTVVIKDELIETASRYLSLPYLRTPQLDWIILDATISREVCEFGEHIKACWLTNSAARGQYVYALGNLAEMNKKDWGRVLDKWVMRLSVAFGLPAGSVYLAFHFNHDALGYWLAGIYSLVVILTICISLVMHIPNFLRFIKRERSPYEKVFAIWKSMFEVWQLLEGPVLNPRMVRDAMLRSKELGAVWDTTSWSIIDRVSAIDAAIWIISVPPD